MALISSRSSGRARVATCTIVLEGKFDPKTWRRVSLMARWLRTSVVQTSSATMSFLIPPAATACSVRPLLNQECEAVLLDPQWGHGSRMTVMSAVARQSISLRSGR